MGKKVNPTLVGAFVLGALALAVTGVLVFGSGRLLRSTQPFVAYFPGSINGLSVGAPVKFKGVEVGTVTAIQLVLDREAGVDTLSIPVYAEIDPAKIVVDTDRVQVGRGKILRQLVDQGLRAQLGQQSLVTGLLFVQLDFFPDTPAQTTARSESVDADIPEIPTVPTTLEEAQTAAREIIDELRKINFGPMMQQASEALHGINDLVSSPAIRETIAELPGTVRSIQEAVQSVRKLTDGLGNQVGPVSAKLQGTMASVEETLKGADETLAAARMLIEPGSPLDYDLRGALRDLSAAALAVQELADYLERNPSSLIYGKEPRQEK